MKLTCVWWGVQELLEGKAEGEATLLAALVNKLGDVDKKVRRPITAVAWDRNQEVLENIESGH